MRKIKIFLQERSGGFLFLLIALSIFIGLSLNISKAQQNTDSEQKSAVEEQQAADDGQVSGETDNNSKENSAVVDEKGFSLKEKRDEKTEISPEADGGYAELSSNLKKYCVKKINFKKCRAYLLEAKDKSKDDKKFKSLYKKYHFEYGDKKQEKTDESSNSNASEDNLKEEAVLAIDYGGGKASDNYSIIIEPGMTVMGMMKKAKDNSGLSYGESADWPGYIQSINGVKEDVSKNTFWILYQNGEMANEGASTLKIKAGDKIEWKYEGYSF